jgi:hypothetical protein
MYGTTKLSNRRRIIMNTEYAAIDPLALLLPGSVYTKLVEKFHPNIPPSMHIQEAVRMMTSAEKKVAQARMKQIAAYCGEIEKAVKSVK